MTLNDFLGHFKGVFWSHPDLGQVIHRTYLERILNGAAYASPIACDGWRRGGGRGLRKVRIRRPVSRVLCRPLRDAAVIPLDRPSRAGSRDLPGSLDRRRPCLLRSARSLFGLAPGGACHAVPVTRSAVRSYRTLSPLPAPRSRRSALCGAIPRVTPGGRYPPPCRRGARTFLDPLARTATARPSDPKRAIAPPSLDGEGQTAKPSG